MTNQMQTHYGNAQTIMQGYLTNRLVLNDAVFPHWITDSQKSNEHFFWYIMFQMRCVSYLFRQWELQAGVSFGVMLGVFFVSQISIAWGASMPSPKKNPLRARGRTAGSFCLGALAAKKDPAARVLAQAYAWAWAWFLAWA